MTQPTPNFWIYKINIPGYSTSYFSDFTSLPNPSSIIYSNSHIWTLTVDTVGSQTIIKRVHKVHGTTMSSANLALGFNKINVNNL